MSLTIHIDRIEGERENGRENGWHFNTGKVVRIIIIKYLDEGSGEGNIGNFQLKVPNYRPAIANDNSDESKKHIHTSFPTAKGAAIQ